MRNLLRLHDTSGNSNKENQLFKRLSKGIAATFLAFSAQYGGILNNSPAFAKTSSEGLNVTERSNYIQASHNYELVGIDHDLLIADKFHTEQNGLVFINGYPALVFAAKGLEDGKDYFVVHDDIGAPGAQVNSKLDELAQSMNINEGYKFDFPDTATNIRDIANDIENGDLSPEQKTQRYYVMLYMLTSMTPWKWEGVGDNLHKVPADIENREGLIDQYVKLLETTNNGSSEFAQLLKEVKIMKSNYFSALLAGFGERDETSERTIETIQQDIDFTEKVLGAVASVNESVLAFQNGDISREQLVIVRSMFNITVKSVTSFVTKMSDRGWANGATYTAMQETSKSTLDTIVKVDAALGPVNNYWNIQELRSFVLNADEKLALATYVAGASASATSSSGDVSFSSVDLATIADNTYTEAQLILSKYPETVLQIGVDVRTPIEQYRIAFAKNMNVDHFDRVAANDKVTERLQTLFARVEAANPGAVDAPVWSTADQAELRKIYMDAYGDPDAQEDFLEGIKSYITLSDPKVSSAVTTIDATLLPHYVEGVNGIETTTEYKAVQYDIQYVVRNRLPIPVKGTVSIEVSPGLILEDKNAAFEIASSTQDTLVTYRGFRIIEPTEQIEAPKSIDTPRATMQLSMNSLSEKFGALPTTEEEQTMVVASTGQASVQVDKVSAVTEVAVAGNKQGIFGQMQAMSKKIRDKIAKAL